MYKYTKRTIAKQLHYYEDARSSYYERLVFPTGFQNFIEVTKNPNAHPLDTRLSVAFKSLEFGDNEKTVIKKLGKPRFTIRENGFSPAVFFYKEELMSHELLLQLHFFNDEFVLATQSIIDTDLKWREIVKITVLEKYGIAADLDDLTTKKNNILFTDNEGNRLFILESINLNLVYCSGKSEHHQRIEEFTRLKIKKINDEVENIKSLLKNSF